MLLLGICEAAPVGAMPMRRLFRLQIEAHKNYTPRPKLDREIDCLKTGVPAVADYAEGFQYDTMIALSDGDVV